MPDVPARQFTAVKDQPPETDGDLVICRSCGKPLTAPQSQALRRGPVCYAKHAGTPPRRKGGIDGEVPLFDLEEEKADANRHT